MTFNSKSVTLNRGINLKINIEIPQTLNSYPITPDMWEESLAEFNKELDSRRQVSEIIDGVKVDILRLKRVSGDVFIWMFAKEKDVDTIQKTRFTFRGKLVFENKESNKVERVLINDLLYGAPSAAKSIFRK